MAHQMKKNGLVVHSGPRYLLQRKELAALLGTVASEWARVETTLMFLYSYLMGRDMPRVRGMGPPIDPVALQVFDTLETARHRTLLLERLAEWRINDAGLLDELRKSARSPATLILRVNSIRTRVTIPRLGFPLRSCNLKRIEWMAAGGNKIFNHLLALRGVSPLPGGKIQHGGDADAAI